MAERDTNEMILKKEEEMTFKVKRCSFQIHIKSQRLK